MFSLMAKFKKNRMNKKGFTLIELIVVIAILGILALVAVPRFIGTLDNAKVKTDVATARTLVSAVAVGEAEGKYNLSTNPPDVATLVTDGFIGETPVPAQNDGTEFVINYSGGAVDTVTVTNAAVSQVYPAPTS